MRCFAHQQGIDRPRRKLIRIEFVRRAQAPAPPAPSGPARGHDAGPCHNPRRIFGRVKVEVIQEQHAAAAGREINQKFMRCAVKPEHPSQCQPAFWYYLSDAPRFK